VRVLSQATSLLTTLWALLPVCAGSPIQRTQFPVPLAPPPGYAMAGGASELEGGSWEEEGFSVEVIRAAGDSASLELLSFAERLEPTRDFLEAEVIRVMGDVADHAVRARHPCLPDPVASAARPSEPTQWWYDDYAGVKIPYAVTGSAVAHLGGVVRALADCDWEEEEVQVTIDFRGDTVLVNRVPLSATLRYRAHVAPLVDQERPPTPPGQELGEPGDTTLLEAVLDLEFRMNCGPGCGLVPHSAHRVGNFF